MDEEERLMRTLNAKANAGFEKKRAEALQQYHGKAAGFQLSTEAEKPKVYPKKEFDPPAHLAVANPNVVAYHPNNEDDARRAKMETSGYGELARYEQDQSKRDEELKRRREEEDRRKKDELANFGSSLARYQEQADQRDRELKARLEEEEKRRRDEVAAQNAKLMSFKQKQEAEEREFRRKREEEERRKQDTLDAMRQADEARRQAALARSKADEDQRRAAAAQSAQQSRLISCSNCGKQLPPEQSVTAKGRPFCYPCSLQASADACGGCGKPILSGTILKAGKKKFHPDCLKCENCNRGLQDGFRDRKGKILCIQCSQGL